MENIRIKVSQQALIEGADEVCSTVEDIKNRFSTIEAAVNRSSGYWKGDAAESHRAAYQEMKGTVDEILAKLTEHTTDLKTMAQGYANAEKEVAEYANALPSDVIL